MKTVLGSNCVVYAEDIEDSAIEQLRNLIKLPGFENDKIRVMPDVHAGAGCVIGFTQKLGEYIIPNLVGVDIGCGMHVVKLGKLRDIDFKKLQSVIETFVPSGMNIRNTENSYHMNPYPQFIDDVEEVYQLVKDLYCYRNLRDSKKLKLSAGTLGGGNHFIELSQDSNGSMYLVIHTGSRNLGYQVANYHQSIATKFRSGYLELMIAQKILIADYKSQGRRSEIQSAIKDLHKNFEVTNPKIPKDLCYFYREEANDYLHDMNLCKIWAGANREMIAEAICYNMGWESENEFTTVHNYIDLSAGILRKGAVSAKKDELLLIPMNMRDGSLLCTGKGNPDWNYSAPHGAGRLMSRTKAKSELSLDGFIDTMKGINTWSVSEDTIDESPMAYKSMASIISQIGETVEIIDVLKPIYNFKAKE